MRPFVVVVMSPSFSDFPYFIQVSEDIGIQYSPSVTSAKALYITILRGFAGLCEFMLNAICMAPYLQFV